MAPHVRGGKNRTGIESYYISTVLMSWDLFHTNAKTAFFHQIEFKLLADTVWMEICSMRGCNAVKSLLTERELVSSSHGKKKRKKKAVCAFSPPAFTSCTDSIPCAAALTGALTLSSEGNHRFGGRHEGTCSWNVLIHSARWQHRSGSNAWKRSHSLSSVK